MDFDMVMEKENNQVSATDEDGLTEEEKLRQWIILVTHYLSYNSHVR